MFNLIHRYKVNKTLKSVGINPKHKTVNQVFDELSTKWNTLTEDTKNNILITLAGNNNINKFRELLKHAYK